MSGLIRVIRTRLSRRPTTLGNNLPQALFHGFLPDEALTPLLANSKINLGFTRMVGDNPDIKGFNQVRLRDFEVPMAGGFYLVERASEYECYFRPGVEVETWETPADLREKIWYYLEHEDKRCAIADAARKRAEKEHTWASRFRMLFSDLGIAAASELSVLGEKKGLGV